MSETIDGLHVVAAGLQFPEGPVAMPDGSLLLVEIRRQTLTRIAPDGTVSMAAKVPGGPNGAALGPDGRVYICNNGGFRWADVHGIMVPVSQAEDYSGGSIDVFDPATGILSTLYRGCGETALKGPNDIVFDAEGGFYFTDLGKRRLSDADIGCVYWARPDGSEIRSVVQPMDRPNGVGLSPDGRTLYVAETLTGRLWAFDIEGPGRVRPFCGHYPGINGRLVAGLPGYQLFDSLAVEASGNICVATLARGAISVFSPNGALVEQVDTGDTHTTNICFGGPDMKTAFVTRAGVGDVISLPWARPGLPLVY